MLISSPAEPSSASGQQLQGRIKSSGVLQLSADPKQSDRSQKHRYRHFSSSCANIHCIPLQHGRHWPEIHMSLPRSLQRGLSSSWLAHGSLHRPHHPSVTWRHFCSLGKHMNDPSEYRDTRRTSACSLTYSPVSLYGCSPEQHGAQCPMALYDVSPSPRHPDSSASAAAFSFSVCSPDSEELSDW